MKLTLIAAVAGAALLVGGCSTRPREFVPMLAAAPTDTSDYQTDLGTCNQLVAQGYKGGFLEAAAAGGGGVAAGYAAGLGSVAAGVTPVGLGMSATAGAALLTIMPVVGIGAAVGITRTIRGGKEKKIKTAMADCLAEHGHAVEGWELAKKRR